MPEGMLDVALADLPEQTIAIEAEGDAVGRFLPGTVEPDYDDERDRSPDFVFVFAAAARVGLLGGERNEPWRCHGTASVAGNDARRARWRLDLAGVPRSALRVLLNMGRHQGFERLALWTVTSGGSISQDSVDAAGLLAVRYPAPYSPAPFPVEREEPLRRSKQRFFRIVFAEPPPNKVIAESYQALDLWTRLILFGGYARPDQHPHDSGALLDMAFLLDSVTVEQSFAEAFVCDEAAFAGAINWAQLVNHSMCKVRKLVVR